MLTDSMERAENTKGDGWKAFYNWKSEGLREVKKLLEEQITLVRDTRNEKRYHCSTCGVEHSVYRIYFSTMHLSILRKVYAYCVENKTHVIEKKEIPGLTHTDYGNFYTLRRFGFLYWLEDDGKKVKGGHWGVAVSRIHDFLTWNWAVAEYSEKNTASQHMENSKTRICIKDIPRYKTLTDDQNSFMPYFVEYQNMEEEYRKASDLYTCDNP